MPNDKKIKIEFAPGAFDNFDGTQEELDELIAQIQSMAESGELEEQSMNLDDDEAWEQLTEEEQSIISASIDHSNHNTRH